MVQESKIWPQIPQYINAVYDNPLIYPQHHKSAYSTASRKGKITTCYHFDLCLRFTLEVFFPSFYFPSIFQTIADVSLLQQKTQTMTSSEVFWISFLLFNV